MPVERDAAGQFALVLDPPAGATVLREPGDLRPHELARLLAIRVRGPRHLLRKVGLRHDRPQRFDVGLDERAQPQPAGVDRER
jgi:hypothetical protein